MAFLECSREEKQSYNFFIKFFTVFCFVFVLSLKFKLDKSLRFVFFNFIYEFIIILYFVLILNTITYSS